MVEPLAAPLATGPAALPDFDAVHRRHPALADFRRRLGGTALVPLPGPVGGATVLGKCEWENPLGSIKDRVAYALLCSVLDEHGDRPAADLRLLEYSGGNLARALGHLGSLVGVTLRFVLPAATPAAVVEELAGRGVSVRLVDGARGFTGVIETALEIAAREPEWRLLYQHRNRVNPAFQEATTGQELIGQLAGRVPAAWVASIGSGGTLLGVRSALTTVNPGLLTVGVTPAELPYGSAQPPNGMPKYQGATGLGDGLRQPFARCCEPELTHRQVGYREALRGMAELRRLTGLTVGSSAAANWLAACEVADRLPPDAVVVTVLPDAGSAEDWQRARQLDG
ncbi:pyridoxal-phosphate dependent enzyme [Kitasatospora sp. NPDC088783]|uniref:pyridoxal-phosphate dependent enzyme n=1 Tax=Kitasatospora sp. NPDC088783 TaxID=3364077 RepID=UPI0038189C56